MKRRRFLAGFSGLAASVTASLGISAFTSTRAERSLKVDTAGDNDALLQLKPLGDGKRSIEDDDSKAVEFSFPGFKERLDDDELGLGVDSVYEFEQDADESGDGSTRGLLQIQNQGTQPVEVYSKHRTDSPLTIELYDVSGEKTALRDRDPKVQLYVGEHINVGFRVRTFGADTGSLYDESLSIVAEAPSE